MSALSPSCSHCSRVSGISKSRLRWVMGRGAAIPGPLGRVGRGLPPRLHTASPFVEDADRMSLPPARIDRLLETALYVSDLAVARAFYADLLGGTVMLD